MDFSKDHYLRTFRTDVGQMEKIVAQALRDGGDWCDLYFEHTTYNELMLRDSEVTSGGFHIDYGVGIRVLSGDKTGYAYSESTDYEDMLAAARAASAVSFASKENKGVRVSGKSRMTDGGVLDRNIYYSDLHPWKDASSKDFIIFLKNLEDRIRAKDNRVAKVIARLSYSHCDILMFNSLGELSFDSRPLGSVTVSVIFSSGGRNESKSASRSFRCGAEMVGENLAAELSEEAVRGIDSLFEAKRPKGGKMSVVMGAGASGILLHEAMGHAFEADFNRKGQSVFAERMGRRICPSGIDIIDDGTIPGNRGACNFDDEGVAGQKTYMVTDGILTSYLHDRISARHYGVQPTGNGRRESFRFAPLPRMRATYMGSGTAEPSDIISGVRKGIYVDEFSNGQVKIGEGDFTFYVKSGFLIENGRLTAPVKDINIIGNGPQALADILAVGNDLKIDNGTWTCGKEQSVPVSVGMPTVLVKSLTVGGE
ncbi:MAG: TldD/PmbA family protein [Candidatus Cryptobacteroides sp.]